ncbi:hypothetical protein CEY09_30640 [Achromobacter marplatensis]|nr:hypothetical protein CEY09_30640 [Achromobacter marplatensis]
MVLCPVCGNKRCPRASNHIYACTRSNEPGQVGSTFIEQPKPQGTINGAIMTKEELSAIANREAHCKPFGAAVTLSVGERDALVAMARLAFDQLDAVDQGELQDWSNTYPAVAWHLIFRHGDNWAHTGVLMERWARAWVKANPEKEEA